MLKTIYAQNEIIKIQSDVIKELYSLLCQHIGVEEAEKLQCTREIERAEELQLEMIGKQAGEEGGRSDVH